MGSIGRLKAVLTRSSDLRRHLLVQSAGTILSQLIPILVAPLLTRLFDPAEFGLYGSVVSISALLAIFVTLRIDHGIMVAPGDDEARKTAILSLMLALAGTLVFAVGAVAVLAAIGMLDSNQLVIWGILVPLAGVLVAAVRTLTLFSNRLKAFRLVSRARILQAVCVALVSLLLGYLALQSYGLVIAMIAGYFLYVAMLAPALWPPVRLDRQDAASLLKANGRFIRFSFPADLVNTLSWRIPFIAFPALFGLEQTGYLALAYTVVATPTRFIGNALGEVFYSHAARQYEETGNCWPTAKNIALLLGMVGLVGFSILFLIAEPAFVIVFGEEWIESAVFTKILIPMIIIRFVASPLSVVFYIAGRQKEDFLWQVAFLLATTVAIFLGVWAGGITASLAAFSAVGSVLYLVYFVLIRRYATDAGRFG